MYICVREEFAVLANSWWPSGGLAAIKAGIDLYIQHQFLKKWIRLICESTCVEHVMILTFCSNVIDRSSKTYQIYNLSLVLHSNCPIRFVVHWTFESRFTYLHSDSKDRETETCDQTAVQSFAEAAETQVIGLSFGSCPKLHETDSFCLDHKTRQRS